MNTAEFPQNSDRSTLALAVFTQLLAFSIPFPIRINAWVTIAAVVVCVATIGITRAFDKRLLKDPLLGIISLQFLILLVGLLRSPEIQSGLGDIERFAFVLAFLFILSQARNAFVSVSQVILPFTIGCIVLTLYGLGYAIVGMDGGQRAEVFSKGHLAYTEIIGIHPTYLSIYLTFSFFFLIELLRTNFSTFTNARKWSLVFILLYLASVISFVRSQLGLLVFLLLLVMYPLIVQKRRVALVAFALFGISLMVYLADARRASNGLDSFGRNVSTALDDRIQLWQGAIEAVKLKPVLGAGTGGEQSLLNEGYAKIGYVQGVENSYNAHNQYLEFLVRNGVAELGVFLFLLCFLFKRSLQKADNTFILFNVTFSFALLAESCLNVQKGIVFFYFFLLAFMLFPDPKGRVSEKE
jgi:O-antigen ligase